MKTATAYKKSSIELMLFKEIKEDLDGMLTKLTNDKMLDKLKDILGHTTVWSHTVCKVLAKLENHLILGATNSNQFHILFEQIEKFKVGDYVYHEDDDDYLKIDTSVEWKMPKETCTTEIQLDNNIISITKFLAEMKKNFIENKKEEAKEKEKEEKEQKATDDRENAYIKKGEFTSDKENLVIKNNKATFRIYNEENNISVQYIGKNIQSIFGYWDSIHRSYGWGENENQLSKDLMLEYAIKNHIDFIYIRLDGMKVEVNFKEDGYIINGIKIKWARLLLLVEKITKKTKKEDIETLAKMNKMKYMILEMKEIKYCSTALKINFVPNNPWNFEVQFINKKANLDWDAIRKLFFQENSISKVEEDLSEDKLIQIVTALKFTKQDVFNYLKKLKMLSDLADDDD